MPKIDDNDSSKKPIGIITLIVLAFAFVYVAPRLFGAIHGIGVNHAKIQIRCFDKAGEVMLEHTAYAPDNIYHDFFSGGYRFKDSKGTTVVSKDADCMVIITPKKEGEKDVE